MEKHLRKTVYRQRFNDGLGKRFRVHVTVMVEDIEHDGKLEEVISCNEWHKVEKAIEKKYPGWFHQCHPNRNGERDASKENCPACQRLTKVKSLIN
jgi:hypothetical protein